MQNNTYDEEIFNVTNTSIAQTSGLRKLTIVVQGGPEIWTVNLCLCGSVGNSFPMSLSIPVKRKSPMTQNLVYKDEPLPSPALPPQASRSHWLSALVAKYTLQDGIESDDEYFPGNDKDESDTDTSDNNRESDDSDDDVYT